MQKGKYIIPAILGNPGDELFLIKGRLVKTQAMTLVRFSTERMMDDEDVQGANELFTGTYTRRPQISRVKVLLTLDDAIADINDREATLVNGYIKNTLPGAFRAKELKQWYIYEKQGDLTPLNLARFAINLMDNSDRSSLLGNLGKRAYHYTHPRYDIYR